MKILKSFLVVGATFVLFHACGSDSSSTDQKREDLTQGGEGQTCQYSQNDGEKINFDQIKVKNFQPTSFHKKLNMNSLRATYQASSDEVVKLAKTQGVSLFRGNSDKNYACEHFLNLPEISGNLASVWGKFYQSSRDQKANLLGVYFPKSDERNPTGKPVIILRKDTAKWTLVHEFTHHLYEEGRENGNEPSTGSFKKQILKTLDRYDKIQKNCYYSSSSCDKEELTRAFLQFSKDLREQMIRYPLEEVSVEGIMIQAYKKGELQFVDDEVRVSKRYIESSISKVNDFFEIIQKELRIFQLELDQNLVDPEIKKWQSVLSEANAVLEQSENLATSLKISHAISIVPDRELNLHAKDCSRHEPVELKEIQDLLSIQP